MTDTSGSGGANRLRWALIASLALNFLIVGAVAGHFLAGQRLGHRGDRGPQMILSAFAKTLPAERREALKGVLDAERQNLKDLRREMRRARRDASATLVTEPFEAEKLKAALARVGDSDSRLKSAGMAIFIDAASKMTAEERRAFKDWREKGRPSLFRDVNRDDDDDNDKGAPPVK